MKSSPALAIVAGTLLFLPSVAGAGAHTWDVNELFSNADGTIQFVELLEANGTANELGLPNVMLMSSTQTFRIGGGPLVAPTSNKFFLIATAEFAALEGAPTPDAIIPAGNVSFFSIDGDTVSYGPYDSLVFSMGELPINGIDSLNADGSMGMNSPTNYSGEMGTVDVPEPDAALLAWAAIVTLVSIRQTADRGKIRG